MESCWSSPMCEYHWGFSSGREQHDRNTMMGGYVLAHDWLRNSAPSTSYVMTKFWTFIGVTLWSGWRTSEDVLHKHLNCV